MPKKVIRVEVSTFVIHMFVKDCLRDSVWFEVTPLPDDRFEVAVKDEPSSVCESLKRYDKHMKGQVPC